MSSRDAILESLRRNAPAVSALPEGMQAIKYDDPEKEFANVLASVGGTFISAANFGDVNRALAKLEPYARARKIASLVHGVGNPNFDLAAINDPHDIEGLDIAIIPGEFGVAENGAVWVPASALGPHRAIFVVTQHLVLVVPVGQIVHNMHDAYARINFKDLAFGTFISGPSKTADIEQSLVIGAHGARSCTVFLVG